MTETMLRELLQEYAADEPPLRLRLADVVDVPSSRPVRRQLAVWTWLVAASVVAIGGGAVWESARLRVDSPLTSPSVSVAAPLAQRVANRTPADKLLDAMRDIAASSFPGATVVRESAVYSWVPVAGLPTRLGPGHEDEGTQWALMVATPDGLRTLAMQSRIVPPDTPDEARPHPTCEAMNAGDVCKAETLPDGRSLVERLSEVTVGSESGETQRRFIHQVSVLDGEVDILVSLARLLLPGERITEAGTVSSESLRAIATDPQLVPPRADPLPPLPSYLACALAHPAPAGCVDPTLARAVATSSATSTRLAEVPADQVADRMKAMAAVVLGPGAKGDTRTVTVAEQKASTALAPTTSPTARPSAEPDRRVIGVVGEFTDASGERVLTLVAEHRDPWAVPEWPLPSSAQPDGTYTLETAGPDLHHRGRLAGVLSRSFGTLHVTATEAVLSGLGERPPAPESLRLTRADLDALASDPGLHLEQPADWP